MVDKNDTNPVGDDKRDGDGKSDSDETYSIEDVVAAYIDRLNSGERVLPDEVIFDHPTWGPEIIAKLEDFLSAGDAPDDESGKPRLGTLGDYTIRREIGRGGMGVVYEAEQISLGRRVALKVLPFTAVLDERHIKRFKNEAHAAALLHHGNIVPVYSVGSDRGVHYYAMQYIDGRTLADIIKELAAAEMGERGPAKPSPETPSSKSGGRATASPGSEFSPGSTRTRDFFYAAVRLAIQAADADIPPHKIALNHNSSDSLRQRDCHAIMAEVSISPQKTVNVEEIASLTVEFLCEIGVLKSRADVIWTDHLDVKYAYPVYTHERPKLLAQIKDWLRPQGIHTVGRFGDWEYVNSDRCVHNGLELGRYLRGPRDPE